MGTTFSSFTATHCLLDRQTGARWLLYKTWLGRLLMRLPLTWWLLSWEHHSLARYASSKRSRSAIPRLIKAYKIQTEDSEKPVEEYTTLQEFFTRKLKPGSRPIAAPGDPDVAVSPADSRLVVYPHVMDAHRLWIKGRSFSISHLLGPGFVEDEWKDAAIAINRLSPADCHRLHAPVTGRLVSMRRLGTRFMASEWVAVHSALNVMTENERLVMEFETPSFGKVVMVPIGASDVGSVQPLIKTGQEVTKGDEVAVFAYGGSIMATLFGAGTIAFDQDLLEHSRRLCETRIYLGQSIGRATRAQHPAGHSGQA